MPRSYADREDDYRKRLLVILPISVGLVALLFVTSDVVPYSELERRIGWEGAIRVLPLVTIIPENDPHEDMRKTSVLQQMASMDVEMHEETGPNEGFAKQEIPVRKPDPETTPELDVSDVRNYPAHTEVPYSEEYVILHTVQPEYPPAELMDGIEGDVWVEILVNEDGQVEDAWVLTAIGPKSFEHSSLLAVRQFRFKPPIANGKPMPMWIRFHVFFRLVS
jgi:TonB family protein